MKSKIIIKKTTTHCCRLLVLSESHPSSAGQRARQSDPSRLSSQVQCQEDEKVSVRFYEPDFINNNRDWVFFFNCVFPLFAG